MIAFIVKRGYIIGKMSIFEGIFASKKQGKGVISCKSDATGPPESISKLLVNKILEVGPA